MNKPHKIKHAKSDSMHMVVPLPVKNPAADKPGRKAQTGAESAPTSTVSLTYGRDLFERWILFLDTLRQRSDNMIEHERQGMPPLLDFKYETILDARGLDRPANYALLRITEVGDDCWEDCVDETKSPVVVVDPRAGHSRPDLKTAKLALRGKSSVLCKAFEHQYHVCGLPISGR